MSYSGPAPELNSWILNFALSAARTGSIVTISIGDRATFRLAGVDRRVGPFTDVDMGSGDLLVFGREHRRVFHGVPKVFPATAPEGLVLPRGSDEPRDAARRTTEASRCVARAYGRASRTSRAPKSSTAPESSPGSDRSGTEMPARSR